MPCHFPVIFEKRVVALKVRNLRTQSHRLWTELELSEWLQQSYRPSRGAFIVSARSTHVTGAAVVPTFREGCHDATGGVVGGQIGYRWQSAGWVFGLEAQGDWADLKGSNVSLFIPAWTNNSKIEAFGLFTGQVGYAWNNVLWYVKGGAAVTDDQYRGTVTGTGALFDSANETRWGGSVGTGLEFGFAPNWSVAVEYDHLFMGNRNHTFTSTGVLGAAVIPVGGVFRTDSIRQDVDLITARINYRFNWGGPVVGKY